MSHDQKLLRIFRQVAIIEGISFLVLLFIAMPIKYGLGMELPVKVTGWIHGVLFLAYCYYLARCWVACRLSITFTALAFLASLVPFGPFFLSHRLPEQAPAG